MKKFFLNFLILVSTYVIPLFYLYLQKEVSVSVGFKWCGFLFFGSILLIYLNYSFYKHVGVLKWIFILFMLIGISGFLYSSFILFMIYAASSVHIGF